MNTKIGIAHCRNDAFSPEGPNGSDLIGLPVDKAARLAKLARSAQILVTNLVRHGCNGIIFSHAQMRRLQGVGEAIQVSEVDWGGGLQGLREWPDTSSINEVASRMQEIYTDMRSEIANRALAEQCSTNGIVAILPARREGDTALSQIKDYLERHLLEPGPDPKMIRVYGIASQDFFHVGAIIFKLFEEHCRLPKGAKVELRTILLDPDANVTQVRASVEHGTGVSNLKKSHVYLDLTDAIAGIKRLQSERQNADFSLQAKLSDFLPQAWCVLTREFIFLEPYHIGRSADQQEYFCLGGRIPIIQASSSSNYYEYFSNQFEFLWNVPDSLKQLFNVKTLTCDA